MLKIRGSLKSIKFKEWDCVELTIIEENGCIDVLVLNHDENLIRNLKERFVQVPKELITFSDFQNMLELAHKCIGREISVSLQGQNVKHIEPCII